MMPVFSFDDSVLTPCDTAKVLGVHTHRYLSLTAQTDQHKSIKLLVNVTQDCF